MGSFVKNAIIADYRLEELISENNLNSSWSAVNTFTGRRVFLKITNPSSTLDPEEVRDISVSALQKQRLIKSRALITSRGFHRHKGNIIAEYPWLDSGKWIHPEPDTIGGDIPGALLEMALTLDYLHRLGLVHCDIKADNYRFSTQNGHIRARLGDLEFLVMEGDSCRAKVFGTDEHIAPEILRGDNISIYADIYSYGVLLRQLRQGLIDTGHLAENSGLAANIEKLSRQAVAPYEYDRPPVLIEALRKYDIISEEQYRLAVRRLFYSFMVAAFLTHRTDLFQDRLKLTDFFDQCQIMGFSTELILDLETAYRANRVITFHAFNALLNNSQITLYNDFWHLKFTNDDLRRLYRELASTAKFPATEVSRVDPAEYDGILKQSAADGIEKYPLKSYLALLDLREKTEKDHAALDGKNLFRLNKILARLSSLIGNIEQAGEFYRAAMEGAIDDDAVSEVILDYATYLAASGKSKDSMDALMAAPFMNDPIGERNAKHYLLRAYLLTRKGEHEQCKRIIDDILAAPTLKGDPVILYKIHNVLGAYYRQQGNLDEAIAHFKLSNQYHAESDETSQMAPSIISLMQIYYSRCDYDKAYETARHLIAGKHAAIPDSKLKFIYLILAHSSFRLGELIESELWYRKYVGVFLRSAGPEQIGKLYESEVYVLLNLGLLRQSVEKGLKSLGMIPEGDFSQFAAILIHLCQLFQFMGDRERSLTYARQALEYFQRQKNQYAFEEVKFHIAIMAYLYNPGADNSEAYECCRKLPEHRLFYYAAVGYLMLIIDYTAETLNYNIEIPEQLKSVIEKNSNPVFKALRIIADLKDVADSETIFIIEQMKKAYSILEDVRQHYWAFFISTKIARLYQSIDNSKLALKYFNNSKRLAQYLGNPALGEIVDGLAAGSQKVVIAQNDATLMLANIHTLLADMSDYEKSLKAMLQFAVDQTGAERGALLLRQAESGSLYIKKYVNCRASQFEEIAKISNNIPYQTMMRNEPLTIGNARIDDRTKDLKSVIEHNIKSVICIPLEYKQELLGVIYLDHHVIPALFDDMEIQLAKTLSRIISLVLATTEDIRMLRQSTEELKEQLQASGIKFKSVFESRQMRKLVEKLPSIAKSNASVLITGESGTGKDVLARLIHDLSMRKHKSIARLNCASISHDLVESELFGIADNVATNVKARKGKFAAADGGTLFLDEIGDMPLAIQAKILHAVENQQFQAVGSNESIHTDIRFIYATNKNMETLIAEKKFRDDLYYRISTFVIDIPPLRERPEDIEPLVESFIGIYSGGPDAGPVISPEIIAAMKAYHWPGNIRELEKTIERLCILKRGQSISMEDLPFQVTARKSTRGKAELDKKSLTRLLDENNWNVSLVARILGIPNTTLIRMMKKLGLK